MLLALLLEDQPDIYVCLLDSLALMLDSPLFHSLPILNLEQVFSNVLFKILQESLSYKLKA